MLLSLFALGSMALFIILSLRKAKEFASLPMHGRLDLYPIPKEKGHEYGGSYYENQEWWNKPREVSLKSEILDMLKEMLFIKKLFDNQKPLWWLSYALHLGIYLIIAWNVSLLAGAITKLMGGAVAASAPLWGRLLHYVTPIFGWSGLTLASFGAFALIVRRITSPILKKYTTPQEYFNLFLLFATTLSGIFVWSKDFFMSSAIVAMKNVLTLSPLNASPLMTIHTLLAGFMLIYIPLSKMSHYVGKYFTFHTVIWENEPNLPGSKVEAKFKEGAQNPPKYKWSAPHIAG